MEDRLIPDPLASKPLEWDDAEDGPFVAPMVENPLYKGPWFPARVENPDFRGEWRPRQRGNPEYQEEVYAFTDLAAVGLELWTVHEGSVWLGVSWHVSHPPKALETTFKWSQICANFLLPMLMA